VITKHILISLYEIPPASLPPFEKRGEIEEKILNVLKLKLSKNWS